jgi:hypothetical protein
MADNYETLWRLVRREAVETWFCKDLAGKKLRIGKIRKALFNSPSKIKRKGVDPLAELRLLDRVPTFWKSPVEAPPTLKATCPSQVADAAIYWVMEELRKLGARIDKTVYHGGYVAWKLPAVSAKNRERKRTLLRMLDKKDDLHALAPRP